MFCGFCFIHFLFCSSTIQPMLYIFRVQGVFYGPCFTSPFFYKFTFYTVYFQVTRFYVSTHRHSPCFGHKVHVLQRPRFLSSFFIRLCYIVHVLQIHVLQILRFTNLRYTTSFFVNRSLQHSTFYEPTFCTVYFRVTTFYVSTLRHSPCFWT